MCVFLVLKPMAMEQVLSDRDSEDEVDDDVADFEDRRVYLMNTDLYVLFHFHVGLLSGGQETFVSINALPILCFFPFCGMNMDGQKMN